MGNRILKDSILRSPQIDHLTPFEETCFYRLIVLADDFGDVDGRPVVLAHDLFPTKDCINKAKIAKAMNKLVSENLVTLYEVDGNPYYHICTWDKHQHLKSPRMKYPRSEVEKNDSEESNNIKKNDHVLEGKHSPTEIQSEKKIRLESEYESESELLESEFEEENEHAHESEDARAREGDQPEDVCGVPLDEFLAEGQQSDEIERKGREYGIFCRDWDSGEPEALDEREDYSLMLEYPHDWVLAAMQDARAAHKHSSRYVLGILKRYKRDGGPTERQRDQPEEKVKLLVDFKPGDKLKLVDSFGRVSEM